MYVEQQLSLGSAYRKMTGLLRQSAVTWTGKYYKFMYWAMHGTRTVDLLHYHNASLSLDYDSSMLKSLGHKTTSSVTIEEHNFNILAQTSKTF